MSNLKLFLKTAKNGRIYAYSRLHGKRCGFEQTIRAGERHSLLTQPCFRLHCGWFTVEVS